MDTSFGLDVDYKQEFILHSVVKEIEDMLERFAPNHYELVGIRKPDGSFDTHFKHTHTLIQKLKLRVGEVISRTLVDSNENIDTNLESSASEKDQSENTQVYITIQNVDE